MYIFNEALGSSFEKLSNFLIEFLFLLVFSLLLLLLPSSSPFCV
jgi:hypothetical protein